MFSNVCKEIIGVRCCNTINGKKCPNCYAYGFPCENCNSFIFSIKPNTMSGKEFRKIASIYGNVRDYTINYGTKKHNLHIELLLKIYLPLLKNLFYKKKIGFKSGLILNTAKFLLKDI